MPPEFHISNQDLIRVAIALVCGAVLRMVVETVYTQNRRPWVAVEGQRLRAFVAKRF